MDWRGREIGLKMKKDEGSEEMEIEIERDRMVSFTLHEDRPKQDRAETESLQ